MNSCLRGLRGANAQGRPGAADAAWHVLQIQDDEAVRVALYAGEADALPAAAAGDVGMVYAHVDGAVGENQAGVLCGVAVDVRDEAAGWVGVNEEGEFVEEGGRGTVVVFEDVGGHAGGREAQDGEESRPDVHLGLIQLPSRNKRSVRSIQ